MKNYLFLLFIALATILSVSAESCSSEEGECANPDVVAEEVAEEVVAVEEDPNCPSRDLIIRCAGKHLDVNQNGKLDRNELEHVIDSLPWYARGILQILGSVDKMVSRKKTKTMSLHLHSCSSMFC